MSKKLVILLSRQRSGTNAFRAVIDSHPRIASFNEIFNYNEWDLQQPHSFITFAQENFSREEMHPDNHLNILEQFIDRLHSLHDKEFTIVDLKYNSCHNISAAYRYLSEYPIFDWIRHNEIPVIRIRRNNYLRVALSLAKARDKKQWQATKDEKISKSLVSLPGPSKDMKKLLRLLRYLQTEDVIVSDAFDDYEKIIELNYTEMFPQLNQPISETTLATVSNFLAIENQFDTDTWCVKLTDRPMWESVDNWQQVCEALAGTKFEYCLADEPVYRGSAPLSGESKIQFKTAGDMINHLRKNAG